MSAINVGFKNPANAAMQHIVIGGFLLGILACSTSSMAQESTALAATEVSTASSDTTQELYRLMYEATMIDTLAYQYAIEHGRLPGDFTLENSILPPDEQDTWSDLYAKGVVSAAELVQILGEGKLDDLTPREMQAFEDLAPVYEPDRTKRIRYDVLSSTNLMLHPAGWSTVGPGVIANSTNIVWTNAVDGAMHFLRLNRTR